MPRGNGTVRNRAPVGGLVVPFKAMNVTCSSSSTNRRRGGNKRAVRGRSRSCKPARTKIGDGKLRESYRLTSAVASINSLSEQERQTTAHGFGDVAAAVTVELLLEAFENGGHQGGAFVDPTGVQLDQGRSRRDALPGG